MRRYRVLIADDHPLIVEGLRKVLEPEFEVAGVAENGLDLVREAERLRPDAILMDIAMPVLNGIEASRQLKRVWPGAKIIFLSQKADRQYVQAAFRSGGSGYLLKQSVVSELAAALRQVLAGHYYVTPLVTKGIPFALINEERNPGDLFGESLTKRQREVLQLLAEGKTAKEIAMVLHISPKTVEFHKGGIMEELGLRTTAELTRYAIEQGIVSS
jgi:DNA-binding NarL/FixJ family response regulator